MRKVGYRFFYSKNKTLYIFNPLSGLWEADAEIFVEAELRKNLIGEDQQKSYYVKEVLDDLKGYVFNPEMPELPEPPNELIAFNNGVYNLKTDEFTSLKPEFYFTNKLGVNYNPNATCPEIDKIFNDIVKDPTDLYELIGYCFIGGILIKRRFFYMEAVAMVRMFLCGF